MSREATERRLRATGLRPAGARRGRSSRWCRAWVVEGRSAASGSRRAGATSPCVTDRRLLLFGVGHFTPAPAPPRRSPTGSTSSRSATSAPTPAAACAACRPGRGDMLLELGGDAWSRRPRAGAAGPREARARRRPSAAEHRRAPAGTLLAERPAPTAADRRWPSSSRSTPARPASARSRSTSTAGRATRSYREFPQYFPRPGWVEHDADEIWSATLATLAEVAAWADRRGRDDRRDRHHQPARDRRRVGPRARAGRGTGRSCGRTGAPRPRCDALRAAGAEPASARATGLVLDPYFSATKLEWLLTEGGVDADADLAFGTVDSLAAVEAHRRARRRRARDRPVEREPHDAVRHRRARLVRRAVRAVRRARARACPRSARAAAGSARPIPTRPPGSRVPVSGIAGDQQAALFGQACFEPGMTKNTYGTGSFVLVNLGPTRPRPVDGLLTTVAWTIGDATAYAMEGAIFVTGAGDPVAARRARHHRRRGRDRPARRERRRHRRRARRPRVHRPRLAVVGPVRARHGARHHPRHGPRASRARGRRVDGVPDPRRRRRDLARRAARRPAELRVDGGAIVMDVLCQFQADLLGVPVRRAAVQETTALGAAYLAGIAEGVWASPAEAAAAWTAEASFTPAMPTRRTRRGASPCGTARSSARAAGRRRRSRRSARDRGLDGLARAWPRARSRRARLRPCFVAYVSTYS